MEEKNVHPLGDTAIDEKNVTPLGDTLIDEKKVIPISEIWIDLKGATYVDPVSVKKECVTSIDEIYQTPNFVNTILKHYCFTCKKDMAVDKIYNYKGVTFCSNECRNKEMEDDAEEEKPKEEVKKVYDNTNSRKRKNYKPRRFMKNVIRSKVCSECNRVHD